MAAVSKALVLSTSDAAATKAVATAISQVAAAGDLVVLAGEMGAGKTTFAQGFAVGLGHHRPGDQPDVHDGP